MRLKQGRIKAATRTHLAKIGTAKIMEYEELLAKYQALLKDNE
jgi:hypothetical protein